MNPLPSIQARLARALLVWSLVWSLAVALAVWLAVQQQVEDLLDDSLQSAAELLKEPLMAEDAALPAESGGPDAAGSGELADDADGGFAWQVVQYSPADAADVLFSSATAPTVAWRLAPTTGFSDGAGWRVFGTRLADDGRFLYVGQTRDERNEVQIEVALSVAAATLSIGLLAHFWLRARVRYELLPVQRLAERLAAHDPIASGRSLGLAECEELQPMHAAIDTLADRLAHRLAQERAFTAHAAHALRTPLAGIDAQLAVALRESPPALQPRLQRVRSAVGRLQRVVSALLTLFRSGVELQRQTIDPAALVTRLAIEGLTVELAETQPISADPDLLAAALLNLLDNALRNGAQRLLLSTPGRDCLRLHDDGPGVAPERLQQLQAAISAQTYEGNTGLGLMLADLIARAHGGQLVLPLVERGFAVELQLG